MFDVTNFVFGLIGGLMVGFFMASLSKIRLESMERASFKQICENKDRIIGSLGGRLRQANQMVISQDASTDVTRIADEFIRQLPRPFQAIARPAAQAMIEKYKEHPEEITKLVTKFIQKGTDVSPSAEDVSSL